LKTIDTLIEDMQTTLRDGVEIDEAKADDFGRELGRMIASRLSPQNKEKRKSYLRFSNMGSPCERKLWYDVNADPEEKEEFSPDTILKFLYGDIIEQLVLFLAEISGHSVEGKQDKVELYGIKGSRDVVLDGVTVDVKSASSFSYKKFAEHKLEQDDAFGYVPQLLGYLEAGQDDSLVTDKGRAAFLAVDKTLGHFCLDFYERKDWNWEEILDHKKGLLKEETPPERAFEPEPMGKGGNEKLGTFCSYCAFKQKCYPDLRTFIYSTGPVFLTKVERVPDVFEVT